MTSIWHQNAGYRQNGLYQGRHPSGKLPLPLARVSTIPVARASRGDTVQEDFPEEAARQGGVQWGVQVTAVGGP